MGIKAEKIESIFGKLKGFMFSKPKRAKLFMFDRKQDVEIHMLFVFFPLIVVWLDEKKRIKNVKVMKPFISFYGEKAKYVLEMPYNPKILPRIKKRF